MEGVLHMSGLSVLVLADSLAEVERLRALLEDADALAATAEVAVSPVAAASRLAAMHFDLVLVDPGASPAQWKDVLARYAGDTPSIILSLDKATAMPVPVPETASYAVVAKAGLTAAVLQRHVCSVLLDHWRKTRDPLTGAALGTFGKALPEPCCLVEAQTHRIVYRNPKFEHMLGVTSVEEPLSIEDLGTSGLSGEIRELLAKTCRSAMRSGSSMSTQAALSDGTRLRLSTDLLLGSSGKRLGGLCRFEVLERPDDALGPSTEADRLFREMAEAAPNIVWLMSPEGKCVYVNKRWHEQTGQEPREALGLGWMAQVHPDDQKACRDAIQQAIVEKGTCIVECRVRSVDGDYRYLLSTGNPRFRDDGSFAGVVGAAKDITESRRVRALMHEADKLAATGRMAARIAHEINNPLGGIQNAFLLIREAIPKGHQYYPYLDRIERELDRIANIVRQTYELYKPGSENVGDCDVAGIIEDVCALLQAKFMESRVGLKSTLPPGDFRLQGANEGLLRQVLFNVLLNAVEASPAGATVELAVRSLDDAVVIEIADAGPGVSDELKDRIFEPFFTTKSHLQRSGLGLGLATSKSLVEAMGGTIEYKPRPRGGTIFCIRLPKTGRSAGEQQ